MDAKQQLRSVLRRRRRELSPDVRREMDERIFQKVVHSDWFRRADTLLLYISCKGEPDTQRILQEAFAQNKQVAVPRCLADGIMEFIRIGSLSDLEAGAYGIPEPTGSEQLVLTDRTVCLVPAVGFTADGKRLGQGGGYYDRFLAAYPHLQTAGICYQCCLCEDLPCEAHDRTVDIVITD